MKYVCIVYKGRHVIEDSRDVVERPLVDVPLPGKEYTVSKPVWLYPSGTGAGARTIFERIEHGDDVVSFRSLDGRYVLVEEDVLVTGDERVPGPGHLLLAGELDERGHFLEVWLPDDRIGLRTYRQTFVCAESDGAGRLVANRTELGEWEKFHYEVPPPELPPKEAEKVDIGEAVRTGVDQRRLTPDRPGLGGVRDSIVRPLG